MKPSRIITLVVLFIMAVFILGGCGGKEQTKTEKPDGQAKEQTKEQAKAPKLPATVSIGTEPVGGAYNVAGAGIAGLISDLTPMRGLVQPSSGVTTWMPKLNDGSLDFGVLNGPNASIAYRGQEGYKQNQNLRMVAAGKLLQNNGYVVRAKSGINSLTELKGKRIATGFGGNIILSKIAEACVAAVGMSLDDYTQVPVPEFIQGLDALQNGTVEATMGVSPTTPKAMEVDSAVGIKVLPFGNLKPSDIKNGIPDNIKTVMDKYVPGMVLDVAPGGVGIVDEDTVVLAYSLYVAASAKTSDDAVYTVLKTLWENTEKLYPVHSWFKDWKSDDMLVLDPPAPWHDGAIKFFKEKGVWTDEHQKVQDRLLAEQ